MELLPIVREVVTIVAAIVAATVSVLGLWAWRRKLRGEIHYDVARRVLRATLLVRDTIDIIRTGAPLPLDGITSVASSEVAPERPETPEILRNRALRDHEAVAQRQLAECLRDLALEVREAEILWGEPAREAVGELRRLTGDFLARLGEYVWMMRSDHEVWQTVERSEERFRRVTDVVLRSVEPDAFRASLERAVAKVENFLAPYLRRGRRSRR